MKKNIIDYLLNSVENYPNKIAFEDGDKSITFAELDNQARKIAGAIEKKIGITKNEPIAVCMDKGVDCIVAFMGVVYSGNYYSPIDMHSPKERIQIVLQTLQPILVITNSTSSLFVEEELLIPQQKNCQIERMLQEENEFDLQAVLKNHLDINPLYVLFTSGSTGVPKGVVISHKSVIDYMEWLSDTFDFDETTVFGNQAPFYFDNSILDIYQTMKNGATMVIIPERMFVFYKELFHFLDERHVNTIFWVPSALIAVANSGILEKYKLDKLRTILFCGEVMPVKYLNIWRKYYPKAVFANLYGPTEITDVCSCYIVDRDFKETESLPIGMACQNTQILVLNESDCLVSQGEVGELCVRGTCLSLGYYGDKLKTQKSFVQNPLNSRYSDLIYRTGDMVKYNERGELIYLCRKDSQIKYQGYRIELGEIDNAGYAIDGIRQVCTVFEDERIIFYCSVSKNISEKEIYSELRKRVPQYMMPKKICILDEIPLNINGKLDRVWLKNREHIQEDNND